MLGIILAIIAPILTFAAGSSFTNPLFKSTVATQKTFGGLCYRIEPNEKFVITQADIDRVQDRNRPSCAQLVGSYTRIKRGVSIVPEKIHDEKDSKRGGCESETWFGQQESTLRLVGMQDDKQIWWLDHNYKMQDMRDFVEVLKDRNDKSNYFLSVEDNGDFIFDVYAKDGILNNLPEYVTNCQETGGLVPVVEGESGIRPPQVVPIKNIDASLFKKNYEKALLASNTSFPPYKNYLIKIDKQDLPAEATPDGQLGVYTTPRVKNEMYAYDVFYHLGAFYLRDKIDETTYVYGGSSEGPPQTVDQNPSLQLGRLWFQLVNSWTAFTPVCKPAVYLYPEKPQEVAVKLDIAGNITVSDPVYNPQTGWNIKANPDGAIQQLNNEAIEQSRRYPYLYYEADLNDGYKPQQGWVVERSDIKNQISNIMKILGLNEKERNDFVDYWTPRLVSKPYYFAGLVPIEDIDNQEALSISPPPANIIRVRLIFEGLDYPISVPLPKLSEIKRNGFTVVDWGGTLVGQSCEGKKIQ